ncbi:MAG: hypothetical protein U0414_05265 [Polyangiaceae bacterium]
MSGALVIGCKTPQAATPSGGKPVGSAKVGSGAAEDLRTVLGPMLGGDQDERTRGGVADPGADGDGEKLREAPKAKDGTGSTSLENSLTIEEMEDDSDGGEDSKKDGRAGPERAAPRSATATGTGEKLSAEQVNAVIDANFERLSACSGGEAIVSLRATVSTDGRVIEASAIRSTPDDPRVRDCVASTFRTLAFPRVASEWPTRLSFDLRVGGS